MGSMAQNTWSSIMRKVNFILGIIKIVAASVVLIISCHLVRDGLSHWFIIVLSTLLFGLVVWSMAFDKDTDNGTD